MSTALSVAVVVLAAGKSSRTCSSRGHKLLAEFGGMPLVRRSTLIASGCECQSVTVVTGHRHLEIQNAIADLDVQLVHNKNYLSGMASSLALGVRTAERGRPEGILIMLADMPAVTVLDLNFLIAAFRNVQGKYIVRAISRGVPGNPVVFPLPLHVRLKALVGDVGARDIIEESALPVIEVDIGEAALTDVDTLDDIIAAGGRLSD